MPDDRRWLEGEDWWPASRGRSWSFQLPTERIVEVLAAVAEKRSDEFSLLQCTRADVAGESRSIYAAQPLDALSLEGSWQYFIRSANLTPVIPANEPLPGTGWAGRFALNGLVVLQHPDPLGGLTGRANSSNIGVMHRVGNNRTGEIREHPEYDGLFAAIKQALRAAGAAAA